MDDKNLPERKIEPREPTDPRATVNIHGLWYAPEEVEQVERQNAALQAAHEKEMKAKWLETTEGKLCMSFYEAFQEYRKYLEEHPPARRRADGAEVDLKNTNYLKKACGSWTITGRNAKKSCDATWRRHKRPRAANTNI